MILGTFGGIITGLAIPVNNALSGRILDDLNSPGDFQAKINQICIDFTIIGGACLFTGFAQVYCWTIAGERQTKKFRMRYVKAILSQEIGWFDSRGSSELSTDVADLTEKVFTMLFYLIVRDCV
jgi:ATP-binding cassette subfamily B (MDR/TAP) protein 1